MIFQYGLELVLIQRIINRVRSHTEKYFTSHTIYYTLFIHIAMFPPSLGIYKQTGMEQLTKNVKNLINQ